MPRIANEQFVANAALKQKLYDLLREKQRRQVVNKIPIIPKLEPVLSEPARYKVIYGGRGAGRTWSVARKLISRAFKEKLLILCTREYQNSIQESVHRVLVDQIERLDLQNHFKITDSNISSASGSEFIFKGLSANIRSLKSFEGVNICWIEEAEKVSDDSYKALIPTIRRPGSEIWINFNPNEEKDPTYQRFVINKDKLPSANVVKITYEDNPWFPDELRMEMEYLRAIDYDAYLHVWEGECLQHGDAQVLRGRFVCQTFEPNPDTWGGPYYGVDWGFAKDPTVMIRCWVHERTLYVEYEAYGIGVDTHKLAKLFEPVVGGVEHISRADSARPETISYMQQHGYPMMRGADKGPGSVEDGVEHLRGYEKIVIHPRCPQTLQEAKLWSYKTDRITGEVQPVLIDKHNHCWDAIRYALEPIIKRSGRGLLDFYKQEAAKTKEANEKQRGQLGAVRTELATASNEAQAARATGANALLGMFKR